jgi:hypothetical protein
MSKTKFPANTNWTRRAFVTNSALAGAAACLPWAGSQLAIAQTASYDFYISPNGSDSNAGTQSSPWAITAINTKRSTYAGRRVGLLDGTYRTGGIAPYAGGYSPSLGVAAGTSGSPTVIQAVNQGAATLDHSGGGTGIIGAQDGTAGHFELRGLRCINGPDFSVFIQRTSGRAEGIKVDSCELGNSSSNKQDITCAVFLQATDDARITNCYFHDVANTTGSSRVSNVLQYGTRRTVVERCTFIGGGGGVHSKYAGGSPRTDDQETTVRQCYFRDVVIACRGFDNKDQTGPGPTAAPYGPFIIENNVFENCGHVLGNDGPFSSGSPVIVRNNTVYATSSGTKDGYNLHTWRAGCEPSYYNNIYYFGGSAAWGELRALTLSSNGSTALANVVDYNCYGPGGMRWTTHSGYGYPFTGTYREHSSPAAWQAATGRDQTGRSLFSIDPQFTLSGTGPARFQLGANSPCRNAGRVGGVTSGAARHMGAWDGVVAQIGSSSGPVPSAVAVTVS